MYELRLEQLLISISFSHHPPLTSETAEIFCQFSHMPRRRYATANHAHIMHPQLSGSNQALSYFVSLWKKALPRVLVLTLARLQMQPCNVLFSSAASLSHSSTI